MFKFNFSTENKEDEPENDVDVKTSQNYDKKNWFQCEEIKFELENDVSKDDLNTLMIAEYDIKYLNNNSLKNEEFSEEIIKAESDHSDLVTAAYEGGLKVWECTFDLANYMNDKEPKLFKDKTILDLGCGAGILGILAHKLGAKVVHFQDYNKDVLTKVTTTNVRLNCSTQNTSDFRFFSGDWADFMNKTVNDVKYDVILTAETIYNTENYSKLLEFFRVRLKENGLILLAAKTYYFGVGGGLRLFEKSLKDDAYFSSELLWKCDIGVKREIIKLSKNK